MPKVAFKQSDVARAIRGAKDGGIEHPSVEILPNGTIRVLTAVEPRRALTPLEEWEHKHGHGDA